MKRTSKSFLIFALIVVSISVLAACGSSKEHMPEKILSEENAVGTWSAKYMHKGDSFYSAFILEPNGSYERVIFKNGDISNSVSGEYEVKDNIVILYDPDGSWMECEYKNGQLINNNHYYSKE